MNLWGVTPLITAALLGAGTHQAAGTSPSPPAVAATAPVLIQVNGDTWQTTVLLTGATRSCPASPADYTLDTTSPVGSLPPARPIRPVPVPKGARRGAVRSCRVTLTFKPLTQVPASATLVVEGSSAQPLTVSRQVTLFAYLGWPGIFGAGLSLLLLLFCLTSVRVFDRSGQLQRPFVRRGRRLRAGEFWRHEVYACGAWSLNDSWATNITAAVAFVTPIVAAIPATELLFRGVALDRFAALVTIAAGLGAGAPLLLAIRYARWQRLHPGVTDDATLRLPLPAWPGRSASLAGRPVMLAAGTLVTVPSAALPAPARPGQPAQQGQAGGQHARPAEQRVRLPTAGRATLGEHAPATPVRWDGSRGRGWLLLPAGTSAVTLARGNPVLLGDGGHAELAGETRTVTLPAGAVAAVSAEVWAAVTADGEGTAALCRRADVWAADGATVSLPWGATAWRPGDDDDLAAASIEAGSKLSIPPDSLISVYGSRLALPGGADLTVLNQCVICVRNRAGGRGGRLIVGASQVAAAKDHPADDLALAFPVWLAAASGATVSATGVAQLTVPDGTMVSAPNRSPAPLSPRRLRSRLPQGPNSLAGTVGMVIAAGLVTMFGIGAQIGLAVVLANLSEFSTAGRWIAGTVLVLAAGFLLRYGVTSISTLADPEPGSSMSTTGGTSFTL